MTTASNVTATLKELAEIIRREIQDHGAIPFARFMELALYCPQFGFYDRFENTIGKTGDYFTNVSVGPLFGELLALRLARWLEEIRSDRWQLAEAGAHDGRLAADILKAFRSESPEKFERVEYCILEPSMRRRRWQEKTLSVFMDRVRWFDSWESLSGGVRGVIFSNELLDAMPVHRVAWDARAREWFEWGVDAGPEEFIWKRIPCSGPVAAHVPDLPSELLAVLPDGFTTEICPAASAWWRQAATVLQRGKLLTIDYGLAAEEFFAPERMHGTARAYRRHRSNGGLLADVGEQDLTAHVNFTAIQEAGESLGLRTEGLFSQAQFLTGIVNATESAGGVPMRWDSRRVRQFQTLIHPDHLGNRFKVLFQSR